MLLVTAVASAQQLTTVANFGGADTAPDYPASTLVQVSNGDLYGTTFYGGSASFGKVESFITCAPQARQFGIQLLTFRQNVAQIERNYGREGAHTLIDNAGVLQLLGAPNRRAAAEFASLVGDITPEEIMALGPLIEGKLHTLRRLRYFEEKMFDGMYDPIGRTRS